MTETNGDETVTESITAEDLQRMQDENAELRRKIEEAHSETATAIAANQTELQVAELFTERVRLEAELANAEQARDAVLANEGNSALLDQVKEQLRVATLQSEAPAGAVDTNANRKEKVDAEGDKPEEVVTSPTPTSGPSGSAPVQSPTPPSSPPSTSTLSDTPDFLK